MFLFLQMMEVWWWSVGVVGASFGEDNCGMEFINALSSLTLPTFASILMPCSVYAMLNLERASHRMFCVVGVSGGEVGVPGPSNSKLNVVISSEDVMEWDS